MAQLRSQLRGMFRPHPQSPEIARYSRSRILYAIGEGNWITVDQIAANTYLAALMIHMGFSDADIGTVMSTGALVCVVELLTLSMNQFFRGKKWLVAITSAFRLGLGALFFIPFMDLPHAWSAPLLVGVYFVSKTIINFGGPAALEWIARLTPLPIRGRYLGTKDGIAVGLQAVVLLAAGVVLDRYRANDPLRAFAILGFMIIGLCIIAFSVYMFTEDCPNSAEEMAAPRQKILPQTMRCLKSRSFRILMTVDILWQLTYYVACPYNASYSIKEMALSFTFISSVGFVGNIVRVFIARKMGAWADRSSMGRILRYTVFLLGVHYLVWAFVMRPSIAVPAYILQAVLGTVAWSFIGVGLFGVKLEMMDAGDRQVQLAVTAAISGVAGFAISFVSGRLLAALQTIDMSLFGMTIYPQQILNILGFCCSLWMCAYIKRVVEREEKQLVKEER